MAHEDDMQKLQNRLQKLLKDNPTDVTDLVDTLREKTAEGEVADPCKERWVFDAWAPVINGLSKANLRYQARAVAFAFYDWLCELQRGNEKRYHKGGASHFVALTHLALGEAHCALWYFTIAFLEDALSQYLAAKKAQAEVDPFPEAPATRALRINFNVSNAFFEKAALTARGSADETDLWQYPESIAVELARSGSYPILSTPGTRDIPVNRHLLGELEGRLDQGTSAEKGKTLEFLASYLVLTLPGVRIIPNAITPEHELDLVVVQHTQQASYLLDALGGTFLVECKNWDERVVGVEQLNHFVAKVRFHRCSCGVLVAREGISGGGVTRKGLAYAELTRLRWYQQDNCAILVVSRDDIKRMLKTGLSFRDLLISKYEALKFTLTDQIAESID